MHEGAVRGGARRRRGRPDAGRLVAAVAAGVCILASAATSPAQAATPMAYMVGFGKQTYAITSLLWGFIIIALLVVSIVIILLLAGMFRRREPPVRIDSAHLSVVREGNGLRWIIIGSAISAVALFGSALWNFAVLANVSGPKSQSPFTIHITGHQWWWEVQYESPEVSRRFATANEIHIPTGREIRVRLDTADVIHSFWIPALMGKMDTIPGQHNIAWIEADKAGVYRGQCTEYCGLQHAHMAMFVIAQKPADFARWWDDQLKPAPQPANPELAQGETDFVQNCGICHTVRGTLANGKVGPDLSHLMTRKTIAAGTLPNTIGALSGWISEPQRIKPGNQMPDLDLSVAQLDHIRNFLATLN